MGTAALGMTAGNDGECISGKQEGCVFSWDVIRIIGWWHDEKYESRITESFAEEVQILF